MVNNKFTHIGYHQVFPKGLCYLYHNIANNGFILQESTWSSLLKTKLCCCVPLPLFRWYWPGTASRVHTGYGGTVDRSWYLASTMHKERVYRSLWRATMFIAITSPHVWPIWPIKSAEPESWLEYSLPVELMKQVRKNVYRVTGVGLTETSPEWRQHVMMTLKSDTPHGRSRL